MIHSPSFLYIIPHTPEEFRTPLRDKLFELTIKSLQDQTYANWRAIVVTDFDHEEGNILYVKSAARRKGEKVTYALQQIGNKLEKPDYVIRLDDDDIINPSVLETASKLEFDCLSDRYHAYYDMVSELTSLQKRDWIPNTVIHKFEYAVTVNSKGTLLSTDHSAWHLFYKDKKLTYLPAGSEPLYLRIISPTSITAGLSNKDNADFSVAIRSYQLYLSSFGNWRNNTMPSFSLYINGLKKIKLDDCWQPYAFYKPITPWMKLKSVIKSKL
ncbi:glycosyltransferase family A protein [Pontibacter arcticus]|uniref:Glycosyl transferase family 2 n=1 Tax=Pontibacter arcticus TaxID=2080288 RepID=A0A364RG22_9BACT|nr:glycosyltransferase family 2 protein [Pontibacter arcticus]RAU83290.1 hypothetical protein DP923_08770 [Pontibacter arcticus]